VGVVEELDEVGGEEAARVFVGGHEEVLVVVDLGGGLLRLGLG
jgi:hypothetical protein